MSVVHQFQNSRNQTKMVSNKSYLIILSIIVFVLSTDDNWKNECFRQLTNVGGFTGDENKTDTFVYAYESLTIPRDNIYNSRNKGILYSYQFDILEKFLEAHENHLQYMFYDSKTYCKNHLHNFTYTNEIKDIDEACTGWMRTNRKFDFGETQKDALTIAFLRLKYYGKTLYMNDLCKSYYRYIKEKTESFVEYTGVRNPSDYCNNNESPPKNVLIVQGGTFEIQPNQQYNQSPAPLYTVHRTTPTYYNFFEPISSSSGVGNGKGLSFDLNELPSDENEEIQFL